MLLFVCGVCVYNLSMLTPKNITELKNTVRTYLAKNPDMRTALAIYSDTEDCDQPDLFAWVRMWAAVQYFNGADGEDVRCAILGFMFD